MSTVNLKKVDLVIVIDTSDSMKDEAAALSKAVNTAVEEAKRSCPSDLRTEYLGIEGKFAKTNFTKTTREYLTKNLSIQASQLAARVKGTVPGAGAQEDLARAIEDISRYYDWRPGAERAIFILGDEGLEGGGYVVTDTTRQANDKAIDTAIANKVKVHTYQGTPHEPFKTPADEEAMTKEYKRLALRTGGEYYIYTKGVADFKQVLEETICASKVPVDESIADKKDEAQQLDGKDKDPQDQDPGDRDKKPADQTAKPTDDHATPPAKGICDLQEEIVKAVNTLADVLKELVTACKPQEGGKKPCRCHGHDDHSSDKPSDSPTPATSPKQPDGKVPEKQEAPAKPQELPAVPEAPKDEELFAIVLQSNSYIWKGNKDDNGDIYSHDVKTGALKRKAVDSAQRMGQSNAITTDGYHYMAVDTSTVYRGKEGATFELMSSLSGGEYLDGFAFRKDNTGYMFRGMKNVVSWFSHDPATTNIARHTLTVLPGAGESRVAFGSLEEQWITDIVFDGNDRAWLIGFYGDLWVVEDTRSPTEWRTRYLFRFPQLTFAGGYTRYIGIAFDSTGNLFLAGGQIESNNSSRRFIAKGSVKDASKLELLYDGGPQSGSYGDLSSQAFPQITL